MPRYRTFCIALVSETTMTSVHIFTDDMFQCLSIFIFATSLPVGRRLSHQRPSCWNHLQNVSRGSIPGVGGTDIIESDR